MATYRTAESVTPAQITVFTHGLGGGGGHWTNANSETGYKFDYDSASMIEQLREKMESNGQEVVVMTAEKNMSIDLSMEKNVFINFGIIRIMII